MSAQFSLQTAVFAGVEVDKAVQRLRLCAG